REERRDLRRLLEREPGLDHGAVALERDRAQVRSGTQLGQRGGQVERQTGADVEETDFAVALVDPARTRVALARLQPRARARVARLAVARMREGDRAVGG